MSNAHFINPSFPSGGGGGSGNRPLPTIPEQDGFARHGVGTIVLNQPETIVGTGSSTGAYHTVRSVKIPVRSVQNSVLDIEFLTYSLTVPTTNIFNSLFIAMWRNGERFFEVDMKGQVSTNRTLWYRHLLMADSDIIRRASIPGVAGNASATAAWTDYSAQISGFDDIEIILKIAAEPGLAVVQDWFKILIY